MSDYYEQEVVRLTGLDEAIIGLASRKGHGEVLAYDAKKIIEILMRNQEMDEDEALEFFYYNIADAWMGDGTPVFVMLDKNILEGYVSDSPVQFH